MTKGERVNKLRKNLNLTMKEFGEKVGVGNTAISCIESGRRNLTQQMIKSICREFHVDSAWLVTGKGDMFKSVDDDTIESFIQIMESPSEFHKNLLKTIAKLDEKEVIALESILNKFIEVTNTNK